MTDLLHTVYMPPCLSRYILIRSTRDSLLRFLLSSHDRLSCISTRTSVISRISIHGKWYTFMPNNADFLHHLNARYPRGIPAAIDTASVPPVYNSP